MADTLQRNDAMADYTQSKIHQYWDDDEFNAMYTILETIEGQLRLIITPNPKKEEKK